MVDYLHGHHDSVLRSHRNRTIENSAAYLTPHLRPEHAVLDVGSGPGTITADFAQRVERVIAVEYNDEALALTRDEVARRGLTNVEFRVGDIHRLDLPDAQVDIAHAHQVLQHLPDPIAALRELARVTKPGGYVAVRDSDYGAFSWFPEEPRLNRWHELYDQLARATGSEPNAGRHYRAWANATGLVDPQITVTTWCYAEPQSVQWWAGLWASRTLKSDFAVGARAAGVSDIELQEISDGWRRWGQNPDAFFSVPSTELLGRVGRPSGEVVDWMPAAG